MSNTHKRAELLEKIRLIIRSELDSVYGNSTHNYTPLVGETEAIQRIADLLEAEL